MDTQEYETLATQIIAAARTTLEPNFSYEQRVSAYQFLEKMKDDVNVAIPCGFLLSRIDQDPQARHLGLQFLEDAIRYHWNDLSQEKKIFMKDNSMQLLRSGTQDILIEPLFIKDKASRLIVEMMKREWPQHWPHLLGDLEKLAAMGETQTELVLLIYLRIAEDVATLQNMDSNQRRRDLFQTFNQNMDQIFLFFFSLLEKHYSKYIFESSENEKLKHCRVVQSVFSTLSCYLEWVSIPCIENHHDKFFTCMCKLILDQNLRQHAVECLLQIVSRKGKLEERKFILSLFTTEAVDSIFRAASMAVEGPLQEKNYLFLKGLTQVVTTLGMQLCSLWGKEEDVFEPQCFPIYLNALLAFTAHPSIVIYNYTNNLWLKLLYNKTISMSDTFRMRIPSWMNIAYPKILKHGYPSKSDNPACEYSRMDFDSDEEYYLFFCQTRSETCEAIKQACGVSPEFIFSFTEERFSEVFSMKSNSESALQVLHIGWERLTHIVERVMTRISEEKQGFKVPTERIKKILRHCIDYRIDDYEIYSLVLTCISGLWFVLPFMPEVCEDILKKLLETVSVGGLTTTIRPKPVKVIRKHAACLILKLCHRFPEILLNSFGFLHEHINKLVEADCISQGEKSTLFQTLLILNNVVNNYQSQRDYITKLIGPVRDNWLSTREVVSSTSAFVNYIGLHKPPENEEEAEMFYLKRTKIFSCTDFMNATLNRCKYPEDSKVAECGGFILRQSEGGNVMRNPMTPLFLSMLPNLFCAIRSHNGLFLPEFVSQLPAYYGNVHKIPPEEINSFLGTRNPKLAIVNVVKTPAQKMQTYLRMLYEMFCLVITNCGPTLGYEFYQYSHLSDCLLQSLYWNLNLLPNIKLRLNVRVLKPLIMSCPKDFHESFVLPLMFHISPVMLNELQSRWDRCSVLENDEDDNVDSEEMVNNMLLHMLTRDYIDAITVLIKEKYVNKEKEGQQHHDAEANGEEMCYEMDTNEGFENCSRGLQFTNVSQLGKLVLRCDALCQSVVLTLLRALSWPDSVCRRKAAPLLFACVQEMLEEGHQNLNAEAVKQIFTCVLTSIHLHGQHNVDLEVCIELAVSLYEKLYPHFPVLKEVLHCIHGVCKNDVTEFENSLNRPSGSAKKANKQNKLKKETFKKVIRNIIGKSVGEALKKEVQLIDLGPIFRGGKYKRPTLDETNTDLNLCSLFGSS